jgi:hypothetical protein
MNFTLTSDQIKKLEEWMDTLPVVPTGSIGGRFTYRFTPHSIGLGVSVYDEATKEELDLTDYESW